MNKSANYFPYVFLLLILILISGCSDSPVSNGTPVETKIIVNGKVLDYYGNGIENVKVIIGSQQTITNSAGDFTISNVSAPYDIFAINTSLNLATCIYGLTITNPQILNSISVILGPAFKVKIPQFEAGSVGLAIFTDTSGYYSGCVKFPPNTSMVDMLLPANNYNILFGSVYYLQYDSSNGFIYTKYGKKSLLYAPGSNTTLEFLPSDLTTVPGTATVSGTIDAPPTCNGMRSELSVNFGSKNTFYIRGGEVKSIDGINFTYKVPTGLPENPEINIFAAALNPPSQKLLTLVNPQTGLVIRLDSVPTLLSPSFNATSVDYNTSFTYTGSGMRHLFFSEGELVKRFSIYTKESIAKIPDLSAYGFPLAPNQSYNWTVGSYPGVNSINNIFSEFMIHNSSIKSFTESDVSHFTTR